MNFCENRSITEVWHGPKYGSLKVAICRHFRLSIPAFLYSKTRKRPKESNFKLRNLMNFSLIDTITFPLLIQEENTGDTRRKLNLLKTFNLRPVSTGKRSRLDAMSIVAIIDLQRQVFKSFMMTSK